MERQKQYLNVKKSRAQEQRDGGKDKDRKEKIEIKESNVNKESYLWIKKEQVRVRGTFEKSRENIDSSLRNKNEKR